MSIASRITSIENHIEEAYTEISRLGVDLTNVNKNIDNIADTLQEAYDNQPKVTDTGSNVSLSNTRVGGLSITPLGACEQDSYSGKNKLPNINPTTQTKRGVTATLLNDGTLQLNGTNTGTSSGQPSDFYFVGDDNNYESLNVSAGNYYFSGITTGSSDTYLLVLIRRRNGANTTFLVTTEEKVVDIQDGDTFRIMARVTYQTSVTNLIMKPMLSATANDTFEKYVGGTASPNPDYPQNIRVVTGDNDVVVSSGNHVPNTWASDYVTRINNTGQAKLSTFDNKQCVQYESNAGYGDYDNKYLYKEDFKANTSYKVNMNWYKTSNAVWNFTFVYTDGTYELFTPDKEISLNTWLNLTAYSNPNKTLKYIRNRWNGDGWGYIEIDSFKVEESQTLPLHLGTNYLAGIGDYKDQIVGTKDNWKVVRQVVTEEITGNKINSNYSYLDSENNFIAVKFAPVTYKLWYTCICNMLTYYNAQSLQNNTTKYQISFIASNYSQQLKFDNTFSTIQEVKDFLDELKANNNPLIVYYVLKEETEETITDTTLINDLNNMYQAMGYDGTTNITISSNSANAQMTAQISALKGE